MGSKWMTTREPTAPPPDSVHGMLDVGGGDEGGHALSRHHARCGGTGEGRDGTGGGEAIPLQREGACGILEARSQHAVPSSRRG